MMKNLNYSLIFCLIAFSTLTYQALSKDSQRIKQDIASKMVYISDGSGKLALRLSYSVGCSIDQLNVNGKSTRASSGTFSSIKPNNE